MEKLLAVRVEPDRWHPGRYQIVAEMQVEELEAHNLALDKARQVAQTIHVSRGEPEVPVTVVE